MTSEQSAEKKSKALVAVILVRGLINIDRDIKQTLTKLRLVRKNCCVVLEKTPSTMGMLKKAKDYITWGTINQETLKTLIEKRSEKNPKDPKKTKAFFRLNSPKKGFGRKGIKASYTKAGALGDRGEDINDLLMRMI